MTPDAARGSSSKTIRDNSIDPEHVHPQNASSVRQVSRLAPRSGHRPATTVARESFFKWADKSYDVVWFSKALTFHLLGRPKLGPTIVDLDDLEDRKIAARVSALLRDRGENGLFRHAGVLSQATLNARRWKAFQKNIAKSVDRVVLCSELDVERFGSRNAVIVPNGSMRQNNQRGESRWVGPPTILLQDLCATALMPTQQTGS